MKAYKEEGIYGYPKAKKNVCLANTFKLTGNNSSIKPKEAADQQDQRPYSTTGQKDDDNQKCRGTRTLCHFRYVSDLSGDEIESVRSGSLTTCASNKLAAVEHLSARELLLTLAHPVPDGIGSQDVIENIT